MLTGTGLDISATLWLAFAVIVTTMLFVDLFVFHRKAHEVKMKEALAWSAVWILLALLFSLGISLSLGHEHGLKFLTGWLIEKALSVDNLFVFIVIFSYFGIAARFQHKILFWGILGALIMRALFISAGVTLVQSLHWILYVFGVFLVYTGFKLFRQTEESVHPEKNIFLRLFRRFIPLDESTEGGVFFRRHGATIAATPLFVALLVIETTDVVFALDSIPAILGITTDPFIVYTSNIFAILGLRALYFALAGFMKLFRYLHYGLAVILIFIGLKMLVADFIEIPIEAALGVVGAILLVSVIASVRMRN